MAVQNLDEAFFEFCIKKKLFQVTLFCPVCRIILSHFRDHCLAQSFGLR